MHGNAVLKQMRSVFEAVQESFTGKYRVTVTQFCQFPVTSNQNFVPVQRPGHGC